MGIGYRPEKKILGTDGYRVPARKNFLGTDGYRVPGKFSLMPTPGLKFRIKSQKRLTWFKFHNQVYNVEKIASFIVGMRNMVSINFQVDSYYGSLKLNETKSKMVAVESFC